MDYKELEAIDKEGAFQDWISVKDAKELDIIPKGFHEYFKDRCSCGSENIIKVERTQMMCCNPRCPVKVGFAIAEMLTRFGKKGLKAATCGKIYSQLLLEDEAQKSKGNEGLFKTKSYVEVIAVPWDKYPVSVASTSKGLEFFEACMSIYNERITFPKLVSNLAIPELSKDAEVLFSGFQNFKEVYDAIKSDGSVYSFCSKRGFSAPSVSFYLRNSVIDIAVANDLLIGAIKPEGNILVQVCMTGSIRLRGSNTTKEKYLKKCNELCIDKDGIAIFEFKMNSAKETNSFILYSRESGDAKYVTGKRRGIINDEFGRHPVLMHTDVFFEFLERMMDSWNQMKRDGMGNPVQELWKLVPEVMQQVLEENKITTLTRTSETSVNPLAQETMKQKDTTRISTKISETTVLESF